MKDEYVREFMEIHERKTGEKLSEPEARDAAERLVALADLMFECAMAEAKRRTRLLAEPGGFAVDSNYSCVLCGTGLTPETGWYDRWGAKCPPCRRAVDSGAVPGYACREHESRYTLWGLQDRFGLKSPTARKLVREGTLVARTTADENGKTLTLIFLKRENPTFAAADPKRQTSWRKSLRRIDEKRAAKEKRKFLGELKSRSRQLHRGKERRPKPSS